MDSQNTKQNNISKVKNMKTDNEQILELIPLMEELKWWNETINPILDKEYAELTGYNWWYTPDHTSCCSIEDEHALAIIAQKAETELCNTKQWYRGSQPLTMYGEASDAKDITLKDAMKIQIQITQ